MVDTSKWEKGALVTGHTDRLEQEAAVYSPAVIAAASKKIAERAQGTVAVVMGEEPTEDEEAPTTDMVLPEDTTEVIERG